MRPHFISMLLFVTVTLFLLAAPARAQIELRGLADIVISGDEDLRALNTMRAGDSYSDPMRTRIFLEGGSGDTRAFVQVLFSDSGSAPNRLFGAYLMHRLVEGRELYLQAGKIPTPQGSWGPRTYADRNPLVSVPLAYFWQNSLSLNEVPADLDALVSLRDGLPGATGGGHRGLFLYDNCWTDGIMVLGTEDQLEYLFGLTYGPPGDPVNGGNQNSSLGLNARLGFAPTPGVAFRVSFGRSAYLHDGTILAAGESVNDFHQTMLVGGLDLERGYFEFHGEFFHSKWDTPLRTDGLSSWSAWGEFQYAFATGWKAAIRAERMAFGEVETTGGSTPWDQEISRIEGGINHRLTRDLTLKAVVQVTDVGNGFGGDTLLPMLQGVLSF